MIEVIKVKIVSSDVFIVKINNMNTPAYSTDLCKKGVNRIKE